MRVPIIARKMTIKKYEVIVRCFESTAPGFDFAVEVGNSRGDYVYALYQIKEMDGRFYTFRNGGQIKTTGRLSEAITAIQRDFRNRCKE